MSRRVVVTGMSGVTSLGRNWREVAANLRRGASGVRVMEGWRDVDGLNTNLGAPIENFEDPACFSRKQLRGAGRVARLALAATHSALADAGLDNADVIRGGDTGVAYGSSSGSVEAISDFGVLVHSGTTNALNSSSYLRMMPHTTAANISVVFQAQGRIIPTSSACASASIAIGYAFEAIKHGYQKLMLAGGAEELDVTGAAVFDTLYATSRMNERPAETPRPFDKDRDGLVVGEGAATLVLEELGHALERGAEIHAEVIGFGTNSDGRHLTQPQQETMEEAIRRALADARIAPSDIGYISAHAAATSAGDRAESHATAKVFGAKTPISSLKGNFGHTLGACGSIEAWLAIEGLKEGWFPPTRGLIQPDPECAELDYIVGEPRELDCDTIISNNFAFGGMNASLIFRKYI